MTEQSLDEQTLARFDYKPGKDGNTEPAELRAMRTTIQEAAKAICCMTRNSREQALAITQLEQAYMWAVAAFCRQR